MSSTHLSLLNIPGWFTLLSHLVSLSKFFAPEFLVPVASHTTLIYPGNKMPQIVYLSIQVVDKIFTIKRPLLFPLLLFLLDGILFSCLNQNCILDRRPITLHIRWGKILSGVLQGHLQSLSFRVQKFLGQSHTVATVVLRSLARWKSGCLFGTRVVLRRLVRLAAVYNRWHSVYAAKVARLGRASLLVFNLEKVWQVIVVQVDLDWGAICFQISSSIAIFTSMSA